MDRHQFDAEDREALIAELTAQRVRSWCLLLQAGDKRATNDLQNTMLDRLSEADAKALFVRAVTDPDYAGVQFAQLVVKVMRDACAAEAENAVGALEKRRQESHEENRIDQAAWARAVH
jgi:hypothetical protein